jgi:hypothetical protein
MIINKDPLLTRIFYRSGPKKIYQLIHSMNLLIQDLLSAIFKLSDFVPKGLLRIFEDPFTMVSGVLHADMGHQGSSGGSSSPALVTLPLSCATLRT